MPYERKYDLTDDQNKILRCLQELGKGDVEDVCEEMDIFPERNNSRSPDFLDVIVAFEDLRVMGYITRYCGSIYEATKEAK